MTYAKTFQVQFDNPLPDTEHGEVLYQITRNQWRTRRDDEPEQRVGGLDQDIYVVLAHTSDHDRDRAT